MAGGVECMDMIEQIGVLVHERNPPYQSHMHRKLKLLSTVLSTGVC